MKVFDLTTDYSREDFADFLSDFLPDDFESQDEEVFYNFTNIEEGYKLGTCKSLDLDIFEFRTKSSRDPRVTLTREVVSCMKKFSYNPNVLAVFYSDESHSWRLSLITTDYSVENGKIKTEHSNPRRFSFKLGEDCKAHTPEEMLFKKGQVCEHSENGKTVTAIEDLKNRFALEVVSKQFFDEYKVFYEDFVQYITGNRYVKVGGKYERKSVSKENMKIFAQFKKLANDDYELACKYVRDYVKKIMGRLVFLQFLQKKGWLGVAPHASWGSGNKNFLLDLFTSSKHKDDFLEKVLEPLFFGMLNTDVDDRKNLFKAKNWDISLLDDFKRIPYLNGGLFEDDSLDELKIKFPQELFSNPQKADKERTFNDKKDYSKEPYPFTEACGLLDFFARYNFTIDETDHSDMEIGVDPEMLGKIFENLLEDNKDKGAFYTPKEIVQYMCRESLIAYLESRCFANAQHDSHSEGAIATEESKIRSLVTAHNADFTNSEKSTLLKALREVKICDPAVGSGAFPMGLLNELFACRVALGEENEPAEIKKQIVRENIYGVDIEKGAIDIARLRFWLAIIVDEKEPIPLPNLDYKIMQGNSLLESFEGIDLSHLTVADSMFDDENDIQYLVNMLGAYFDKHEEKAAIRDAIKVSVLDLVKKRGIGNKTYDALSKLDLHANSEFFLWHTWFNDVFNRPKECNSAGGFDIVIGNPPYFNVQTLGAKSPYVHSIMKIYSDIWQDKSDILFYFFRLAMKISKGVICFITSNAYLFSDKAQRLRKKMIEDGRMRKIVNFEEFMIFGKASITTCITLFSDEKEDFSAINLKGKDYSVKEVMEYIRNPSNAYKVKLSADSVFALVDSKIDDLNAKIDGKHKPLRELFKIGKGMETAANKVFCFSEYPSQFPKEFVKRRMCGEIISRYHITEKEEYMLYFEDVENFEDLPVSIQEHLNANKEALCSRAQIKRSKTSAWWKYTFAMHKEYYHLHKIWCSYRAKTNEFVLDESSDYIGLTNTTVIFDTNEKLSLKYLLALLNSKLLTFRYRSIGKQTGSGVFEYFENGVGKVPIPSATPAQQKPIIDLVGKILAAKKVVSTGSTTVSADTASDERKIDLLVYHLYGLTCDEAKVIDESLTEVEFNAGAGQR